MSYYNANKTNSSSLMCFSNVPNEKSMIKQLRPNVASINLSMKYKSEFSCSLRAYNLFLYTMNAVGIYAKTLSSYNLKSILFLLSLEVENSKFQAIKKYSMLQYSLADIVYSIYII